MDHVIIPLPPRAQDKTGHTYGRLTVISPVGKNKHGHIYWLCICECGNEHIPTSGNLTNGSTKSCGCLAYESKSKRKTTHGMSKTPEYSVWCWIKDRCQNQNNPSYKNYGQRGIFICDIWNESFEQFFADMGERPTPAHTIDRIDNSGNYEPGNCKWSTRLEQANNKRSNTLINYQGKTLTLAQWSKHTGIHRNTLCNRINRLGWSIHKSMTHPVRKRGH